MSEAGNLFTLLRQSVDGGAAAAIEELVQNAPDRALSRVNVLDFAAKTGVDQESAISAFLHAARLGIFELSWNVLCPGCVLTAGAWIVALITSVPLFSVLYMLIVQGGFRMSRHMGHRHFLRCFCYSADGAARYS